MKALKNLLGSMACFIGVSYLFLGVFSAGYIPLVMDAYKHSLAGGVIMTIIAASWWALAIGMFIGTSSEID